MPTDLERVIRAHIADLRRSAVVMSKYVQMGALAEETRKAANELEAALQAQQPGGVNDGGKEYSITSCDSGAKKQKTNITKISPWLQVIEKKE